MTEGQETRERIIEMILNSDAVKFDSAEALIKAAEKIRAYIVTGSQNV